MEIKVTLTNSEAEQFIFIVKVDGKEVQNCSIGELVNPDHFDWACNMSAAAVHGHLQKMNPVKRKVRRTKRALDGANFCLKCGHVHAKSAACIQPRQ